ncbi:hypothetical protein NM22_06895 [Vibrio tubiashii]|uniref:hypothetical protein n=1 Tax=Vibrio sp. M260118 TaxID=3020896 RepID=UPI000536EFE0|nr:hypothetical protein NM22_06895 [Vibrio tubiashii]
MNKYIFPILLSFLTVSVSVNAAGKGNGQTERMSQAPVFTDIDVNQDGLISKEEFADFQKARQELRKSEGRLLRNSSSSESMFDNIDIDQNEFIDMDEFQSHRGSRRNSNL